MILIIIILSPSLYELNARPTTLIVITSWSSRLFDRKYQEIGNSWQLIQFESLIQKQPDWRKSIGFCILPVIGYNHAIILGYIVTDDEEIYLIIICSAHCFEARQMGIHGDIILVWELGKIISFRFVENATLDSRLIGKRKGW